MAHEEEQSLVEVLLYPGPKLPKGYRDVVRTRWARNYRRDNDFMRLVQRDAYYYAYKPYIMSILRRPNTEVRLATLDEGEVVVGFSVMENTTLHYVHVPKDYRKNGIGGALVPVTVEWFSHITTIGLKLWGRKFPEAKFNPFHP